MHTTFVCTRTMRVRRISVASAATACNDERLALLADAKYATALSMRSLGLCSFCKIKAAGQLGRLGCASGDTVHAAHRRIRVNCDGSSPCDKNSVVQSLYPCILDQRNIQQYKSLKLTLSRGYKTSHLSAVLTAVYVQAPGNH